jgi:hypothetical protein
MIESGALVSPPFCSDFNRRINLHCRPSRRHRAIQGWFGHRPIHEHGDLGPTGSKISGGSDPRRICGSARVGAKSAAGLQTKRAIDQGTKSTGCFMRVAMIGSGHVGPVSGACFADFGHQFRSSLKSTWSQRRSHSSAAAGRVGRRKNLTFRPHGVTRVCVSRHRMQLLGAIYIAKH